MEELNVRTAGQGSACAAGSSPADAGTEKQGKMHIIVDLAKCVGCYNCLMACKDEHVGNDWPPVTEQQQKHEQKWIFTGRHERGTAPYTEVCFVTKLCQHCENAPCEKARPDAVIRRDDGVVLLDAVKAKGDRSLLEACPYGMISWNSELGTAQKCTMCAHLLDDGWKEPRCVQACPLRALSVVKCEDGEFSKLAEEWELKPLTGGEHAPRVMYKNIYLYDTCFIAGALAYMDGDIERAAADADVRLEKNGKLVAEAKTDFFGEFKMDRIPKDSGMYELICSLGDFQTIRKEVTVAEASPCLGVTLFEKVK